MLSEHLIPFSPFLSTVPHKIEIFSGGCHLCKKVVDIVTIGKCAGCQMDIINVKDQKDRRLAEYGITSVPSIVIDGRIKVVGIPNFPWFCGDEFYKTLEEKYSLVRSSIN